MDKSSRRTIKPGTRSESSQRTEPLEPIHPHAAGIDLGADMHWVSVPVGSDTEPVRQFSCFTPDLLAMAEWLRQCGVSTVAMEATGVYWIPVFQVLETAGFEVKLVNPHHVKTVPGRKSDVLDCQWLQKLHSYGLLAGSFRPEAQVCVLRSYLRQRESLIQNRCAHVQRMAKALTQMNIQLHRVISDLTGVTGLAILRAIVGGERDPHKLVALKHPLVKSSDEQVVAALTGDYRAEHVFVLSQELALYEVYQAQITACEQQIQQCLASFADKQPEEHPSSPETPEPSSAQRPQGDLRSELLRISGIDFTRIDGLAVLTVQTILSEVGLDPTRFPSVKHFTSWLGLCPGNHVTGGKAKRTHTRKVVNRAATAFRLAAQSVGRTQTALGAFYRRMRARLGAPKAITATAHKIARMFYRMWTSGGTYQDPGADYYEQRYQQRLLDNLKKKADSLGFNLVKQVSPQGVS
jgi:transposase